MEIKSFTDIDCSEAGDFLDFPDKIYRDDQKYIPPLKKSVLNQLDMQRNPFFEYGSAKYFLAQSGDEILGRIASFRNPKMDYNGTKLGTVGYFESINDPLVADSLLRAAIDWLKNKDCNEVWGPMNGSIWNSYRFKTEFLDEEPFIGEPYNPEYYPQLFEQFGFKRKHLWYSSLIDLNNNSEALQQISDKYEKHFYLSKEQGYTFKPNKAAHFDLEFQEIYSFFLEAFDGFFGYYKITFKEFTFLYYSLKQIIRDNQIVYVTKDGETKGIMIHYDDFAKPFRSMQGKSNLMAKVKFLLNRDIDRVMLALVGLTKDEIKRPSSLAPALAHLSFKQARDRKIPKIIHMLMSEENKSNRFGRDISRRIGTYALYNMEI